jgi:hypothetical protein
MSNLTPENIEKLFYEKAANNYKEFQKKLNATRPRSPRLKTKTVPRPPRLTEKQKMEKELKNAKTIKQLKSIYRAGAKKFHPNKGGSNKNMQEWTIAYKKREKNLSQKN